MTLVNPDYKPLWRADNPVRNVQSNTMLILLAGINTAAITGDKEPCTAIDSPAML